MADSRGPRIVVVGAGAFGGWTALELVRRGARVTLVDAWGPGHTRSSSGGDTRVLRATYGSHAIYTRLAARALERWNEHERRHGVRLFHRTGALWMFGDNDSFGRASLRTLRDQHIAIDEWTPADAARRYPQINFSGIRTVLHEPDAGYLLARRACAHVAAQVEAEGGEFRLGAVLPPDRSGRESLTHVTQSSGDVLGADAFVFACGPWLGALFPDVIGERIQVTKQEIYYFGTPAGDPRFTDPVLPVWLDFDTHQVYGIPGNLHRGFKMADDTPGPVFDPTRGTRDVTAEGVASARTFLAKRFPALADAPLIGSEVCQYESTPDAHFIIDRHPALSNVWIAGGGSGHGFKMGPAVGELLASLVLTQGDAEPSFSLGRFSRPPERGWQAKWS